MVKRLKEATEMLLQLEEQNDEQVIDISRLQLTKLEAEKKLEQEKELVETEKASLEQQLADEKLVVEKVNKELIDLKTKLEEIEKSKASDEVN